MLEKTTSYRMIIPGDFDGVHLWKHSYKSEFWITSESKDDLIQALRDLAYRVHKALKEVEDA